MPISKIPGKGTQNLFNNISDAGTEGTKVATGTTAQRGTTAGQWRFNTTTGYFEGRNNAGEFSTLEPTPTIASVDVTEVDSQAGGNVTFVITGTNFSSGGTITFVGNSGVDFNASTTTFNSVTQVTAVAPKASFLNAQEPYKIKFASTSGVQGTSSSGLISVDTSPTWTTSAGSLGSIFNYSTGNHFTVAASDADSDTIAYSLQSGSLAGLSLNSSSGVISGDPTDVSSDTTNNFTLRATANSKNVDRAFSYITKPGLENNANTLAFFDFASGQSYDGTSTLQDLTTRNKDLTLGNASYNAANGGVLIGSSTQNVRATGLTGAINEVSMGVWVKLEGVTSGKGVIYYGDTATNNHFFIRDAIGSVPYNFDVGKDINGSDTWTKSQYSGSNMSNYITGVSGYASKFWYYVVRVNSSGLVTTSLNKSAFETTVNAQVNMSGHSSGQFGIFGDPYDDNSSSHTIGVAWWYNGVISQADSDAVYDRYATRFGY